MNETRSSAPSSSSLVARIQKSRFQVWFWRSACTSMRPTMPTVPASRWTPRGARRRPARYATNASPFHTNTPSESALTEVPSASNIRWMAHDAMAKPVSARRLTRPSRGASRPNPIAPPNNAALPSKLKGPVGPALDCTSGPAGEIDVEVGGVGGVDGVGVGEGGTPGGVGGVGGTEGEVGGAGGVLALA